MIRKIVQFYPLGLMMIVIKYPLCPGHSLSQIKILERVWNQLDIQNAEKRISDFLSQKNAVFEKAFCCFFSAEKVAKKSRCAKKVRFFI